MLMVVVAVVVVMVLAFPRVQGFGKNVRQFIPRQVFFFFLRGDELAHTKFTL